MLKNKLKQIGLLLGDLICLYLSLYLALTLRYLSLPNAESWEANSQAFLAVFLLLLLIFYISNLYNLRIFATKPKFLKAFFKGLGIGLIISIIYFYLFPFNGLSPKTNLLIFTLILAIIFLAWRYLAYYLLKNRLPKNNLGVIGYHPRITEIINELKKHPQLGWTIKFIIEDNHDKIDPEIKKEIAIFSSADSLEELASKYNLDGLILVESVSQNPELQKKLFNCLPLTLSYFTLPNFYERLTGKIPLEVITQSWFLENLDLQAKKNFEILKRVLDIICASLCLVISLPFWLIIAGLIRINSRGPILFRQIRLGKNNTPFSIIKFRTMIVIGNDQSLTKENDGRITAVGKFLRQTRLDEIPQVINVLKGEMSFVGPRPERPELIAQLKEIIPFYDIRALVKPGLTGWDQISGEYHSPLPLDTAKKLQHDLFYIKNRSAYLDTTIVLKTIKTVLTKGGR